jgi:hypothetical protein
VASIAPASSLARRVSTLPRNGMMRRSGAVPAAAPSGAG